VRLRDVRQPSRLAALNPSMSDEKWSERPFAEAVLSDAVEGLHLLSMKGRSAQRGRRFGLSGGGREGRASSSWRLAGRVAVAWRPR
jgi:hypothetical protein